MLLQQFLDSGRRACLADLEGKVAGLRLLTRGEATHKAGHMDVIRKCKRLERQSAKTPFM